MKASVQRRDARVEQPTATSAAAGVSFESYRSAAADTLGYLQERADRSDSVRRLESLQSMADEGRANGGAPVVQRAKGLKAGTYVEVTGGGRPWYGQIEQVLEDSYKIRVGGTSRSVLVPEADVGIHPVIERAVESKIATLHKKKDILSLAQDGPLKPEELSEGNQQTYQEIKRYLIENPGESKLHDGAKKTLVSEGAKEALKIYRRRKSGVPDGVYDQEKASYNLLEEFSNDEWSDVDLNDFVRQWGWNDVAGTARAEALTSNEPTGNSVQEKDENRSKTVGRVLQALSEMGYFMTDLGRGDNIGSIGDRSVVFDVKSLVPYNPKVHFLPE